MESASYSTKQTCVEPGSVHAGVLCSLIYSDIFNHPLTFDEIREDLLFAGASAIAVSSAISELLEQGLIHRDGLFYSIRSSRKLGKERIKGNIRAGKYLKVARVFAGIISGFPFVRGIALSGSISKGVVNETGDVDFFIITASNRLWVCRTLLMLFKKIFLLNSRKYFCLNYFIDENSLEINEKNIFTATELVHLIPVYKPEMFYKMLEQNKWIEDIYMNRKGLSEPVKFVTSISPVKPVVELILKGYPGRKADELFLKLTLNRWKKKFGGTSGFDVNFRSTAHVSKHHPAGYQHRITAAFEKAVKEFENLHQVKLI